MIDYSYLTPPSKVNRIKLPRTSSPTQNPTSTKTSTAATSVVSSLDPSTSHSRRKASINSKITSKRRHPTSTILISYFCASITPAISF